MHTTGLYRSTCEAKTYFRALLHCVDTNRKKKRKHEVDKWIITTSDKHIQMAKSVAAATLVSSRLSPHLWREGFVLKAACHFSVFRAVHAPLPPAQPSCWHQWTLTNTGSAPKPLWLRLRTVYTSHSLLWRMRTCEGKTITLSCRFWPEETSMTTSDVMFTIMTRSRTPIGLLQPFTCQGASCSILISIQSLSITPCTRLHAALQALPDNACSQTKLNLYATKAWREDAAAMLSSCPCKQSWTCLFPHWIWFSIDLPQSCFHY